MSLSLWYISFDYRYGSFIMRLRKGRELCDFYVTDELGVPFY